MIQDKFLDSIFMFCALIGWDKMWIICDVFIIVMGLLANVPLLWIFLKEQKPLSASQILGVNMVVMNLIYLSVKPVGLMSTHDLEKFRNRINQGFEPFDWKDADPPHIVDVIRDIFSMFNLVGCPLLLSCMCIERYLAVMKPVLYLKVRKKERLVVTAGVWLITSVFCVFSGLMSDITITIIPVSITISCLFLLMISCLCGIIWSLMQQSPAHTTFGNQAPSECPQKRQAVWNVLVVVVPAVISYLPVLPMMPLAVFIQYNNHVLGLEVCNVFELSTLFPRFGVFIGPLFYLSKARKLCCLGFYQAKHEK